jgi:hypothetical protein
MGIVLAVSSLLISANAPLVYFDMEKCLAALPDDSVLRYDTLKFVASLEGLANRNEPRLAIRFLRQGERSLDDYWLEKQQQGWLKDRTIQQENDFDRLLTLFPDAMTGVVVWDPAVPATANVAATVCGVEGWLPVRAGGALYARIVDGGPKLPVKLDLAGRFDGKESGSAKCDAYLWAKREYLDKGRCNPALMAFYLDGYTHEPGKPGLHYTDLHNAGLANHDYYIAQKAFFFDLDPWGDETPVDDPKQPTGTDRKTLIALLHSQYEQNQGKQFTSVGGFVPWNLKYTTDGPAGGKHDPVPAEWEYAAILSAHNAIMDADALGLVCLPNASAYRHYPLKPRYEQNPKPAQRPLEKKTYVLIYMGDYDSAAWLSRMIPEIWDDPTRGELPVAWAFNPNLAARVPYVFDYVYATKSPNDWFIAGDSGAGYLNPNLLTGDRLGSGLPDALDVWVDHNRTWYERFGYSITGFAINGFHGKMPLRVQEAYAKFSPDGVGMQQGFAKKVVNGAPFLVHSSDIYPDGNDLAKAAEQMARFAKPDKPQFLIFRWILQKPDTMKKVRDLMIARHGDQNWEFCDPYTFFDLYRRSVEKE